MIGQSSILKQLGKDQTIAPGRVLMNYGVDRRDLNRAQLPCGKYLNPIFAKRIPRVWPLGFDLGRPSYQDSSRPRIETPWARRFRAHGAMP